MKAILKFTLPEEASDHYRCVKADSMAFALFDFANNTRREIEEDIKDDTTPYDAIEAVYKAFYAILDDHGINIDKLV